MDGHIIFVDIVSPLIEAMSRSTNSGDDLPTSIHRCGVILGALIYSLEDEIRWGRSHNFVAMRCDRAR